jgi:uncharacterized protein involved in exopolysaccharide biosynthesis
LNVEPLRKTNVIAVSYNAGDPRLAAKVLRELAASYLEKHAQVRRPTGEFSFFEQQSGESRRRLEEAQHKLLQFTLSHGVVSASQQRDLALQKLSEVDGNYRQSRIELAETGRRVRELETQLPMLSQRTTTQVRTADNAELMKALKASLLDLELKRIQLLTKFEPSHRLVQEIEQQIAQTKAAIAGETLSPIRDETTDKNPNYEWAKLELQRAQVLRGALEARAAATGSQVLAYEATARQFGEEAITQDDLLSAEKTAEENHLLYVKKQEQARMDDALDEHGIVNAMIAEQPVAPALPVHSAWMVLMVGFVAAGASGTGAAFVADYLDPAFRTPDEALAYLHAPVLASLPKNAGAGNSRLGETPDERRRLTVRGLGRGGWRYRRPQGAGDSSEAGRVEPGEFRTGADPWSGPTGVFCKRHAPVSASSVQRCGFSHRCRKYLPKSGGGPRIADG